MSILSHLTYVAQKVTVPGLPTTSANDTTLRNVFSVVLALAGAVAVAFIVFGGIKYMLSQGDAGDIKQSKDTILYAIVGLIIVAISFMLVNYVIGQF